MSTKIFFFLKTVFHLTKTLTDILTAEKKFHTFSTKNYQTIVDANFSLHPKTKIKSGGGLFFI